MSQSPPGGRAPPIPPAPRLCASAREEGGGAAGGGASREHGAGSGEFGGGDGSCRAGAGDPLRATLSRSFKRGYRSLSVSAKIAPGSMLPAPGLEAPPPLSRRGRLCRTPSSMLPAPCFTCSPLPASRAPRSPLHSSLPDPPRKEKARSAGGAERAGKSS